MPGPSPSVPIAGRRRYGLISVVAAWVLLALASAARFVFETAVSPSVPDGGLVFSTAVASAFLLLIVGGLPRLSELRLLGVRRGVYAFLAGAAGLAVAPVLVAANRYSDAPAGTVVAFWTLAGWGLLLAAVPAWQARRPLHVTGAIVALVGCMGILGSWERPSSFSLLVRFPREEMAFLVAGVAWAVFAVVVSGYARDRGAPTAYALAGAGGLVGALAWAIPSSGWEPAAILPSVHMLPAALTAAIMVVTTLHLARVTDTHVAGAALLAAPALITTLLVVEEATGTFGPRPVILTEAWWGTAVVAAGVAVILVRPERGVSPAAPKVPPRPAVRNIGVGLAIASAGAALLALMLPGVAVVVRGTTAASAVFTADFTLSAFHTVGGWLVFAAAALAVAAWLEHPRRERVAAALVAALTMLVAHATLAFTPLRTWMSWIPAEVQHDYGTEYASIVFSAVSTTAQVVGIVGASLALGTLLVWSSLSHRGAHVVSESDTGGRDR